jgi:VWFA-related protein
VRRGRVAVRGGGTPGVRSIGATLLLGCGLSLTVPAGVLAQEATPLPSYTATVEVRRVVVDVRVVDAKGIPVKGLTAANFKVLVDDRPAPLESAEWIEGTQPYAEGLTPDQAAEAGVEPAPRGRLLVFLFQVGYESVRLTGQMRMSSRAERVLASLTPDDLVAVVSYDSHLKLRVDFTTDRERVKSAIHDAILAGKVERLPPGPPPSLAATLDYTAADEAATPERGLYVLAQALRDLPGSKSLVYFGWGLGTYFGGHVRMGTDYARASAALRAGHVSVYSIDVTDADLHDLEVGLEQVADDTGGFYVKTNQFPDQAVTRIEGAIAGYYTLVFASPTTRHGDHAVAISLVNATGNILGSFRFHD